MGRAEKEMKGDKGLGWGGKRAEGEGTGWED